MSGSVVVVAWAMAHAARVPRCSVVAICGGMVASRVRRSEDWLVGTFTDDGAAAWAVAFTGDLEREGRALVGGPVEVRLSDAEWRGVRLLRGVWADLALDVMLDALGKDLTLEP